MLVLFNKPYNVLSQFTDKSEKKSQRENLSDYLNIANIYPAGRLDRDSEGLLLLTDNGKLQQKLSDPKFGKQKGYWVQVEGDITPQAIEQLQRGILLKDGLTKPAKAKIIAQPEIWQRTPPIRERKNIPTSWLELYITEGKNRQVRRMTAAMGFPTLRLIRFAVDKWQLQSLVPGQYTIIKKLNE